MKKIILSTLIALSTQVSNAQWVQTHDYTTATVYGFAQIGTNTFAGTDLGIYHSTNNGSSWTKKNNGFNDSLVVTLTVNGTDLYAGMNEGGLYKTSNYGTSWSYLGLKTEYVHSVLIVGTKIYAGSYGGGVFVSSNNGVKWDAMNTGMTSKLVQSIVMVGTNLFAGTADDGVFMSTNGGTSWTAVNTGLTNTKISVMVVSGTSIFAGTEDGGVFLTANNGTSWTEKNNGLANTSINGMVMRGTKNIFVATNGSGVYMSNNAGASWKAVNSPATTNFTVDGIGINGTTVFAGTYEDGIWQRPISEMGTGIDDINNVNSDFQMYPDPANGKFTINHNEQVTSILIQNMIGQIVYNETLLIPQIISEIDLSAMEKGIYFVTVYESQKTTTKKIVIQ